MLGPACKRVEEAPGLFDAEKLYHEGSGIVDYIIGQSLFIALLIYPAIIVPQVI